VEQHQSPRRTAHQRGVFEVKPRAGAEPLQQPGPRSGFRSPPRGSGSAAHTAQPLHHREAGRAATRFPAPLRPPSRPRAAGEEQRRPVARTVARRGPHRPRPEGARRVASAPAMLSTVARQRAVSPRTAPRGSPTSTHPPDARRVRERGSKARGVAVASTARAAIRNGLRMPRCGRTHRPDRETAPARRRRPAPTRGAMPRSEKPFSSLR